MKANDYFYPNIHNVEWERHNALRKIKNAQIDSYLNDIKPTFIKTTMQKIILDTIEEKPEPTDEAYAEVDELFDKNINKETGALISDQFVYEMAQLLTIKEQALANAFEAGQKSREMEIVDKLNPNLKELQYIGKAISEWQKTCERLGIEIIWQDIGDEVMGKNERPLKAVSYSPLKAYQEVIKAQSQIEKQRDCRHIFELHRKPLSAKYEEAEPTPNDLSTKKVCKLCGYEA